jgi:multidrug transporter EmrE-like cation transporter
VLKSLVLILAAIIIAVGGQFSLKYGVGQIGRIDGSAMASPLTLVLKVVLNKYVILGLGLYGLGAAVWIVVLSRVPLSFAYPMLGLSYVAVVLVSALVLREHVTLVRWLGVFLIVAGVALVGQTHDDRAKQGMGGGTPELASAGDRL